MAIIVIINLWDIALPTVCTYYDKQNTSGVVIKRIDIGLWPRFVHTIYPA